MSDDIKKEIRKQYFRYFRIWFIIVGILLTLAIILGVIRAIRNNMPRSNHSAPAERVYDYADVLTDAEEELLRRRIAETESRLHIDIVLVTINQPVEGMDAMLEYGFRSADWEHNMRDYADDFWDENQYGYNKGFEGDGCIFVHNWYEGQSGGYLSTSGKVEDTFSTYDIDSVFNAVKRYYATDPYKAYEAYIDTVSSVMSGGGSVPFSFGIALLISIVAALVYALVNLHQKKAKDTTTAATYVDGGKPVMRARTDDFIRKSVVSRRIETSSSGGSGSSHGGGAGHHTSRSGASHGGGGRRF